MKQAMEDGVSVVLSSVVKDVDQAVSRNINGAQLLHELLSAPWLCALLKIYECLLKFQRLTPSPVLPYAAGLSHEALLSSHDSVAQSDYEPVLPPLPDEIPEDEEAMRIVCLVKNNQPLGATIRKDEATGDISIARVIHGGLADRSGIQVF
ncbi:MAGUK p55 subfamily member 4-like [Pundamilia nyererei]|uniref:MAGUK p55 subfamily member 4-like n=1 Tax=Pundamilia nyererei TaxID=303518 RepID=A0A9Y3RZ95_9CICH|nr:PREDICTED: MAGUK p55 subfamily member 4-like [Pundamilia nyererei]